MNKRTVFKGVEEIVLLCSEETFLKKLNVRIFSIERGMETEAKEFRGDIMYYILSGKGSLVARQL